MKNLKHLFKRLTFGIVLTSMPLIGGCGENTLTWTEEVKLLDGRVITVTQKRRISPNGRMPREAWLTFKLPEFGDKEIVWHENLETQVLNVYQGKLYVVGIPFIEETYRQYGRPYPEYVPYRYEEEQWKRIPFNEIPVEIYNTNMYFENMTLYKLTHVSLLYKENMLKEEGYVDGQRRLSPTFKTPH